MLRQRAYDVVEIDGALVRLADEMIDTMYSAPGLGLAAPQIGVQKRFFVYDLDDDSGPHVIVNPVIEEFDGEWAFEEGCLSVPGLSWEIVRPKKVLMSGVDLDGNDLSLEADELLARLYQHELDHLDGVLLIDRLDEDQKREAKRAVRQLMLDATEAQVEDSVLRLH